MPLMGLQLSQTMLMTLHLNQLTFLRCSSSIDQRLKLKLEESFYFQQYFKKLIIKALFSNKIKHRPQLLRPSLSQTLLDQSKVKSPQQSIKNKQIVVQRVKTYIQANLPISIIIFAKIRLMSIVSIKIFIHKITQSVETYFSFLNS